MVVVVERIPDTMRRAPGPDGAPGISMSWSSVQRVRWSTPVPEDYNWDEGWTVWDPALQGDPR